MSYLGKDAGGDETPDPGSHKINDNTTPFRPNFTPDEDPYTMGLDAERIDVEKETTITARDSIREIQDGQKNPENPGKLKGALRL